MAQETGDFNKILGGRLHDLRLKRKPGLHRRDVAEELGLAASTYNDYERGDRGPKGWMLVKLAKYYNTTVDYLYGNTDDDSPIDEEDLKKNLSGVKRYVAGEKKLSHQEVLDLEESLKNLLEQLKESK